MGKNIVIVGDSHVLFYTQTFMSDDDFYKYQFSILEGETCRSGSFSKDIRDNHVRFIWKIRKTAFSASKDYFDTIFDVYAYDIANIDYVIFQQGTPDLSGPLSKNGYANSEESIDRFLNSIQEFSKDKAWKPVVTTTLAHERHVPRNEIDRWNAYLTDRCNALNIKIIDVFDAVNKNFIPQSWDDCHLNRFDSLKSLLHILKNLD